MKTRAKSRFGIEWMVVGLLSLGLVASVVTVAGRIAKGSQRAQDSGWLEPTQQAPAVPIDLQSLEHAQHVAEEPVQLRASEQGMLVSELRVVAIGSAYPIPYEAEVCPFSDIPQPTMDQLDRDGDGMTDDWELKFGLDKYNTADANQDADGDHFTNLEEFRFSTDPTVEGSHPPFALKLRFVERKDIPFPVIFQGSIVLPDGRQVFQLNTPADGKTHFRALGEDLEGIVLQRFIARDGTSPDQLIVVRGSSEITLVLGQITADPESQAELINILDRSPIMVTMDALLSLYDDDYMVLGVYATKVVMKHLRTGEVFDIVGLAEGEPVSSSEDL
jgi:hypothetical protein